MFATLSALEAADSGFCSRINVVVFNGGGGAGGVRAGVGAAAGDERAAEGGGHAAVCVEAARFALQCILLALCLQRDSSV
jgi:hypothetical protein